jgi:hypothetical protein
MTGSIPHSSHVRRRSVSRGRIVSGRRFGDGPLPNCPSKNCEPPPAKAYKTGGGVGPAAGHILEEKRSPPQGRPARRPPRGTSAARGDEGNTRRRFGNWVGATTSPAKKKTAGTGPTMGLERRINTTTVPDVGRKGPTPNWLRQRRIGIVPQHLDCRAPLRPMVGQVLEVQLALPVARFRWDEIIVVEMRQRGADGGQLALFGLVFIHQRKGAWISTDDRLDAAADRASRRLASGPRQG